MKREYRVLEAISPNYWAEKAEKPTTVITKRRCECECCDNSRVVQKEHKNVTASSYRRLQRLVNNPPAGVFRSLFLWSDAITIELYEYS